MPATAGRANDGGGFGAGRVVVGGHSASRSGDGSGSGTARERARPKQHRCAGSSTAAREAFGGERRGCAGLPERSGVAGMGGRPAVACMKPGC